LAEAVIAICEGESNFRFLYDLNLSIEEKINTIGKEIYGADGIELSDLAKQQVDTYTRQGYNALPSKDPRVSSLSIVSFTRILVCMAKTQYSFSHDPKLKNVPTGTFFCLGLSSLLHQLQIFYRIQTAHKSSPIIGGRWLPVPYSWGYANYARTRHTAR
jgi:formyltetrahydrofolate synthetase